MRPDSRGYWVGEPGAGYPDVMVTMAPSHISNTHTHTHTHTQGYPPGAPPPQPGFGQPAGYPPPGAGYPPPAGGFPPGGPPADFPFTGRFEESHVFPNVNSGTSGGQSAMKRQLYSRPFTLRETASFIFQY